MPRSALILSNVGLPMVLKIGPNRPVRLVQPEIEHYSGLLKIPKINENQPKLIKNRVKPRIGGKTVSCPNPVLKSWVYLNPKRTKIKWGKLGNNNSTSYHPIVILNPNKINKLKKKRHVG